jgi:hypothetical protein
LSTFAGSDSSAADDSLEGAALSELSELSDLAAGALLSLAGLGLLGTAAG